MENKFNPTSIEFTYMLSKHDCFRKLTGKCSLQLTDSEKKRYTLAERTLTEDDTYWDFEANSMYYCPLLLKSIQNKGMQNSIEINPHSCGHYSFSSGQHRTCIAKTSGIQNIPANIHKAWNSECRVCYFKKKNYIFKVKNWLGKTKEFVR
ncbi:hypothetical protein H1230_16440 [Paenibacillus sp. 19GGS1-52]|uniref:hypothetical protein n=1 Tax=Paenibacillus sp. 19GGS1-52 TaxID=2758563 RepID=UPI001EFA9C95|nr:hypothetical protein [Paenibacillus sp. 19GGS1-52]ULO04752.1 hypothetical protein H1230_16440 [Paenibacillus sp. 19GGS1-52]